MKTTWKPRLIRAALALFVLLLVVVLVVSIVGVPITPWVEARLTRLVKERYASDLEFSAIHVSLLPLTADISDVVFRHKGHRDRPPLVRVKRATARMGLASLISMFTGTPTVKSVQLEGLRIQIDRSKPKEAKTGKKSSEKPRFVIQELVADGTQLTVYPKDTWKEPLVFDLKSLRMRDVGLHQPMRFVAVLTNAKPPGLIHTEGDYGPFDADEPGDTPLRGEYKFENANLADFEGIGGILSSTGRFQGQLDRIEVLGTTDTPDFHLDVSENRVHLKTEFKAIVDGTNGDTLLEPVTATFGNSKVVVRGGVYGIEGVKGKTVRLDVDVDEGRIEDMLAFATKSEPVLTGPIRYTAKMEIPPGKGSVVEKLKLEGKFRVASGEFTSEKVQEKLGELSKRAKGKPKAPTPDNTATNFGGHFRLGGGQLRLPDLTFQIPGAEVRLNGSYHLVSEMIDFQGLVHMDAKVSQTTTGMKSVFLRLVDPLLRGKDGRGSTIPIKIKGHRSKPEYGLDFGKVIKR